MVVALLRYLRYPINPVNTAPNIPHTANKFPQVGKLVLATIMQHKDPKDEQLYQRNFKNHFKENLVTLIVFPPTKYVTGHTVWKFFTNHVKPSMIKW
jgi:hypothetical protein